MFLRRYIKSDIDDIIMLIRIAAKEFPQKKHHFAEKKIRTLLYTKLDDVDFLVVLCIDTKTNKPIGFISAYIEVHKFTTVPVAQTMFMYVKKKYRSLKIISLMINYFETWVKGHNVNEIHISQSSGYKMEAMEKLFTRVFNYKTVGFLMVKEL